MIKESFDITVPRDVKEKYLKRKTQDLARLRSLSRENVFTEAMKLGHQVKGNASSFEFPFLARIGSEIEKAAKAKNSERLQKLLTELETLVKDSESNL